jgi:ADP-heptose:LPS heptosyltransferase
MRIAIVRRNGLGDLLAVMPLVKLCKEKHPGCHVTLFVDHRNAPLVPYLEGFDEAIVIEPSKNKYISLVKTLLKNRHRSFDLVISARPTPMQWLNLFLAGLKTPRRRAVVDGSWHSRWINEPVAFEKESKYHQMVKGLRLMDASMEEVPQRLMPKLNVKKSYNFDEKTILVSVTNTRIGSQLDSDKIANHLNKAFEQFPFRVIINCEPKDLQRAQDAATLLKMNSSIIPTPNFDDFMGLLASVDASWTGDGGIMHLMGAMDKPQLVLFGKTALWEWAPLSKKAICVRHAENVNLIPEHEIQEGLERLIHELR